MTDKELLELAAKAAGIDLQGADGVSPWYWVNKADLETEFWNPLTNDGDALRLAVKLHITIDRAEAIDAAYCYCDWRDTTGVAEVVPHGDDPLAATRRCIVRAAAEIGRAMK